MNTRTYYGADGMIHDDYGDNTPHHRIGGTYQVSPWWFNRNKKSKRKKRKSSKNTRAAERSDRIRQSFFLFLFHECAASRHI